MPSAALISSLARHRVQPPSLTLVSVVARPVVQPPEPPTAAELRRLLTGVLEVLDRRRPAAQLTGLLPCRDQRALLTTALSAGEGPRRLRSVFVSRTGPDVVDLCARIEHLGRSRAMTGRLELRADHWEFTLLELV